MRVRDIPHGKDNRVTSRNSTRETRPSDTVNHLGESPRDVRIHDATHDALGDAR